MKFEEIAFGVFFLGLALFCLDATFPKPVTNIEATVAVKKFAPKEHENQSIYMLVIVRNASVWKTRVSKKYWESINIGDVVPITRHFGRLSGRQYYAELWTGQNARSPIYNAQTLHNHSLTD